METLEAWSCSPAAAGGLAAATAGGGPLFTLAVQALLAAQCAIVHPSQNPPDRTTDILNGKTDFDFIVVGSGSAGAVVANRLSEIENWDVLLIEAGGDPTLANEVPLLFYRTLNSKGDWRYVTEPTGACKATYDGGCRWPRGKVLGGCSAINAMFYVRGNKADYDEWESLGNQDWGYDKVLEYFRKSEDFNGDEEYYEKNKNYHGKGGYLRVEKYKYQDSLAEFLRAAFREAGVDEGYDTNGEKQTGFFETFANIKDGRRMSTARAFLNPVKDRKNLYVIKNALATNIVIENKVAKGIKVILNNGETANIKAKKEVIISGGSINTPQLLMISGVGPAEHLKGLDIDVIQNLPVGENLQDHVVSPVFFEVKRGLLKAPTHIEVGKFYADYLTGDDSMFSSLLTGKITGFIDTKDKLGKIPDIQYHFISLSPNDTILFDLFFKGHSYSEEATLAVRKHNQESMVLMAFTILLKPKSQGSLTLKSKEGEEHPSINPNYYKEEEDLDTMARGMATMEELEDTEVFKNERIKLIKLDYEPCVKFQIRTDPYRKCIAQHYGFTLYHPVGTAKMGPKSNPTSVVDDKLKVHGIEGLRVVDASVMPTIVRGNTHAPVVMIAEKASDLIKDQWLERHEEL